MNDLVIKAEGAFNKLLILFHKTSRSLTIDVCIRFPGAVSAVVNVKRLLMAGLGHQRSERSVSYTIEISGDRSVENLFSAVAGVYSVNQHSQILQIL